MYNRLQNQYYTNIIVFYFFFVYLDNLIVNRVERKTPEPKFVQRDGYVQKNVSVQVTNLQHFSPLFRFFFRKILLTFALFCI